MSGLSELLLPDLEDKLSCPLCFELLKQPQMLECLHSVCDKCTFAIARNNYPDYLRCPQCFQVTHRSMLKPDFRCQTLLDLVHKTKLTAHCEQCDRLCAPGGCELCDINVCEECLDKHHELHRTEENDIKLRAFIEKKKKELEGKKNQISTALMNMLLEKEDVGVFYFDQEKKMIETLDKARQEIVHKIDKYFSAEKLKVTQFTQRHVQHLEDHYSAAAEKLENYLHKMNVDDAVTLATMNEIGSYQIQQLVKTVTPDPYSRIHLKVSKEQSNAASWEMEKAVCVGLVEELEVKSDESKEALPVEPVEKTAVSKPNKLMAFFNIYNNLDILTKAAIKERLFAILPVVIALYVLFFQ